MVNEVLEFVFSGLIMSLMCHYMWIKLSKINIRQQFIRILVSLICLAIILIFNYCFINSYLKIIISALCCLIITLFITKKLKISIILTMFTEVLFILSEIIFSIVMLAIFGSNLDIIMNKYFGSLVTNVCICIITFIVFSFPFAKKFYSFLLQITEKIKMKSIIVLAIVLIISINIFLAMPYYEIDTLVVVIVNSLLLIVYSFIMFKFVQAKNRYIDISDKYSLTESSLKELQNNVNRLMTINHENKNQLLTIRTMVANKDKNILKNIDAIIEQKVKDDKELKVRTSVIANTMLGALVYSKLLTMKEKDIKHSLHIDKALSKVDFINLGDKTNIDICKIVGIYLDNAIEAVSEIHTKEISIELYLDEGNMFISISNSFIGNIDIDSINDYGYTTKSEGHGYGLSLAKEVIKDNEQLSSETEILNNVFIQKLKIKM